MPDPDDEPMTCEERFNGFLLVVYLFLFFTCGVPLLGAIQYFASKL